jgi:hypothetical protein
MRHGDPNPLAALALGEMADQRILLNAVASAFSARVLPTLAERDPDWALHQRAAADFIVLAGNRRNLTLLDKALAADRLMGECACKALGMDPETGEKTDG